jgi:3-phenylpropionate/cinnamic acid dioxygenase small subunit
MSCEDDSSPVENRFQRLKDREVIRELRHEYAYTIDENDWDAFLDLFTDDARVELPDGGTDGHTYEGLEDL